MAVHDGVLKLARYGTVHQANVAHDGSFRLEMPTKSTYKRSRGANNNKSEVTIILQGSLAGDEPSGLHTIGAAYLNNQGCEAKTKYSRL